MLNTSQAVIHGRKSDNSDSFHDTPSDVLLTKDDLS